MCTGYCRLLMKRGVAAAVTLQRVGALLWLEMASMMHLPLQLLMLA